MFYFKKHFRSNSGIFLFLFQNNNFKQKVWALYSIKCLFYFYPTFFATCKSVVQVTGSGGDPGMETSWSSNQYFAFPPSQINIFVCNKVCNDLGKIVSRGERRTSSLCLIGQPYPNSVFINSSLLSEPMKAQFSIQCIYSWLPYFSSMIMPGCHYTFIIWIW